MIYVDELRYYPGKTKLSGWWCHMWTDGNIHELHLMANELYMDHKWFQHSNERFQHYDLRPSKRKMALKLGAKEMLLRDYIQSRNPR